LVTHQDDILIAQQEALVNAKSYCLSEATESIRVSNIDGCRFFLKHQFLAFKGFFEFR